MNTQQQSALALIVKAVVDTIRETGTHGAPSGVMYAALMSQGCSLNQYQSLMSALVNSGKIRQDGDLYFIS